MKKKKVNEIKNGLYTDFKHVYLFETLIMCSFGTSDICLFELRLWICVFL